MFSLNRRKLLTGMLVSGATAAPMADVYAATLRATPTQTNSVLGAGGMHHTAIRTRDWDRTLMFYQQVLGFHVKLAWQEVLGSMDERLGADASRPRNQRWAYLASGDETCIEVFEDANFNPPPPGTDPTNTPGSPIVHVGIRTSRLDHVWETARAFGAKLGDGPTAYTLHTTSGQGPIVVRLCFIQGPSGEWIELIENAP
jgi:catechol 2,3-dioxygenase-like lactoylglutathione lyase family enzyme